MPLNTLTVIAAATPTVVATYFSHYLTRGQHRHTPLAHLSYHEGVALIRRFLAHASHHTVEQLQAFTAMYVPRPAWVRTEDVEVPTEFLERAGEFLERQLGEKGLREVGGRRWWKWREGRLRAEWVAIRDGWGLGAPRKKAGAEKKTVLYVHGGAYYFGSVDEHRYLLQRHARKIKARVFAREYCSFLLGRGLRGGGRYGVGGGAVGIREDGVGGAVYNGGALVFPALKVVRIEVDSIGPARPQQCAMFRMSAIEGLTWGVYSTLPTGSAISVSLRNIRYPYMLPVSPVNPTSVEYYHCG